MFCPYFTTHYALKVYSTRFGPFFIKFDLLYSIFEIGYLSCIWGKSRRTPHPCLPLFVPLGLVAFSTGRDQIVDFGNIACRFFILNQWAQVIPFGCFIATISATVAALIHS